MGFEFVLHQDIGLVLGYRVKGGGVKVRVSVLEIMC